MLLFSRLHRVILTFTLHLHQTNSCQLTRSLLVNTHTSLPVRESRDVSLPLAAKTAQHTNTHTRPIIKHKNWRRRGSNLGAMETAHNTEPLRKEGMSEASWCRRMLDCPVPGTKLSGCAQAVTNVDKVIVYMRPDALNRYIKHLSTLQQSYAHMPTLCSTKGCRLVFTWDSKCLR